MTEQEKQQLVDAVITQLKNEGTDVSSATVVEDVNGVSYVLCYDTNGNIVRVSPDTINQQESTNKTAIEALGMALQDGLNQEATARNNLAKEIRANAMQYDTLGVYVGADKAEIYGRSINTTPRVVEFPAATTEKAGVMTAGDKKKVNASIKNINVNPNVDDVELDLEDNTEKTSHVVFPAATTEKAGVMSAEDKVALDSIPNEIEKLKDGDTVVGQAREIHSRNGKTVADSFLIRTTAGSGTIGDGVASLKSVGGNIVKNLVDGTFETWFPSTPTSVVVDKGVVSLYNDTAKILQVSTAEINLILNHKYYISVFAKSDSDVLYSFNSLNKNVAGITTHNRWCFISFIGSHTNDAYKQTILRATSATYLHATKPLLIDLTEMFGAGNEPDKATCDKLFGTMDALPQGLTVANPTTFTSTGFNQFNPESVLEGKAIVDNAIVSGDKKIAVIPCLPCKVGVGENNGYCIHGDFGDDINVYLTPLNPMEVDGELYMHELTKDATTDTYVPLIKGYMLVEVPTTDNLCAHFLWSEDKCERDTYEPYFESKVELPVIPQMSEWGLAGIQTSGTLACDEIDFERGVYVKRIQRINLSEEKWHEASTSRFYCEFGSSYESAKANIVVSNAYISTKFNSYSQEDMTIASTGRYVYIKDSRYATADELRASFTNEYMFVLLATPEEYPLPKVDNNYISSDYGVEQFDSVVPCNANNLYYMRSLAGETRNFLDRMYDNTAKTDAKEVADYITNGIEGNKELATNAPNLALRALYVAAGAIYNNSTGYYELNGITDLTESNMIYIYDHKNYHFSLNTARYFQENKNVRTIFPMNSVNTVYDQLFKNNKLSLVCTFMNSNFEVIKFSKAQTLAQVKGIPTESGGMSNMFTNAKKLKTIYPIDVSAVTSIGTSFNGTIALIDVRLQGLKCSAAFKDSANISKESILYIIQNATPTTAITITLHADAYARLAEDADIVAALEAQPLVTLVSA